MSLDLVGPSPDLPDPTVLDLAAQRVVDGVGRPSDNVDAVALEFHSDVPNADRASCLDEHQEDGMTESCPPQHNRRALREAMEHVRRG